MGRILAVANPKGGSGKTTTVVNLAECLARQRRRVLLVDLNPQGHVALALGIDSEQLEKTAYEVLTRHEDIRVPIRHARIEVAAGLDLVPANLALSVLEHELATRPRREQRLRDVLAEVRPDYDYLLIDTPPSLGLLTLIALRAASELLIPCEAGRYTEPAVRRLAERVALLNEEYHQGIILYGLQTNFDNRSAFSRMMFEEQRSVFPGVFLKTIVHVSSKIREATFCGMPIVQFDRHCRAAKEFLALAREIIAREPLVAPLALDEAVPSQALTMPPEQEEILFRVQAPEARRVAIVGTFNRWQSETMPMSGPDAEGYWYASVVLPRGAHQYKYVVDQSWINDPENPLRQNDGFGGTNSVVEI